MIKPLEDLKDLKSAFIAHCKELGCDEAYIKACKNKFNNIEKVLEKQENAKKQCLTCKWYRCEFVKRPKNQGNYEIHYCDKGTSPRYHGSYLQKDELKIGCKNYVKDTALNKYIKSTPYEKLLYEYKQLKEKCKEKKTINVAEMEAPIIEPNPKNYSYIKADFTKNGTLVFTPTNDPKEAVDIKTLNKLMKAVN